MWHKVLALVMSAEALFAPILSSAAQVRLRRDVALGDLSSSVSVGLLASGSVVEIPDAYLVKTNGVLDFDSSLNNWLRDAGRLTEGALSETYFPVKIIRATEGSVLTGVPALPLISMHFLIRSGDSLIVSEPAPLHSILSLKELGLLSLREYGRKLEEEAALASSQEEDFTPLQTPLILPPEPLPPSLALGARHGSVPKSPVGVVKVPVTKPSAVKIPHLVLKPTPMVVPQVKALPRVQDWPLRADMGHAQKSPPETPRFEDSKQELQGHLGAAMQELKGRVNGNLNRIQYSQNNRKEFLCGEIRMKDFHSYIDQESDKAGIPRGLLNRLMIVESNGNPFAEGDKTARHSSLGLFQVNTSGSRVPRCSKSQLEFIKSRKTTLEDLMLQPQCLQNPVVNLRESIRLLNTKYNTLMRSTTIRTGLFHVASAKAKGFTKEQLDRTRVDTWRVVMSAYNGGELWTLLAKHDLDEFNKKNGTHLDAGNWEDLRLFFFRRWLERPMQSKKFPAYRDGGRLKKYTLINVAYAESILPRAPR